MKKVDALTKAMEVESKRMKREAAAREKEAATVKVVDNKKNRTITSSKRYYVLQKLSASFMPFLLKNIFHDRKPFFYPNAQLKFHLLNVMY